MQIILDCHYSSYVNGTADENSDRDTIFVFHAPSHSPMNPFGTNTDDKKVYLKNRTGIPYWAFMRDLFMGDCYALDLLYLPPFAYTKAPSPSLLNARSGFAHVNAFESYRYRARNMKEEAISGEYSRKRAYHSYLYLNSAMKLGTIGEPCFYDPHSVSLLKNIRYHYTKEQFLEAYAPVAEMVDTLVPALPKRPDYRWVLDVFANTLRDAS